MMNYLHLKNKLFIVFSLPVILFASCDSSRVYEENKVIENQLWNVNNKISFYVDIQDTLALYNFYVNVRHATDYPYSNLFLFLETRYPKLKISRDTLECILADGNGKWLGDGSGDIWDNQILFKRNFRFPYSGIYTFNLQQAMRLENLPQILDVGIRIEKSEIAKNIKK